MAHNKLVLVLSVLLFLSLGTNFFFVGWMVGGSVGGEQAYSTTLATDDAHHAEYVKQADKTLRNSLSEKDKKILRRHMMSHKGELRRLKRAFSDAREEVQQLMQQTPVDGQALNAALRAENNTQQELMRVMNEMRSGAMKQLSPEGRRALLESRRGFGGRGLEGHKFDRHDKMRERFKSERSERRQRRHIQPQDRIETPPKHR